MNRSLLLVAAMMLTAGLAGCGSKSTDQPTSDQPVLSNGKGGIQGLVIDDRYRPIPSAIILLTPAGLTATADGEGQFVFRDLEPGSYEARVQADGHEAAPQTVDVVADQYVDLELSARRIFSTTGATIVTQYSVFIDCTWETPVAGSTNGGCTGDQSGDSSRGYYMTQLAPQDANVTTYMVTEAIFNQQGDYTVAIRGAKDPLNIYYAEADLLGGTYLRIQMQANGTDDRPSENQGRNIPWDPQAKFQTIVFPHGEGYSTVHSTVCPPGVPGVVSFTCLYGAGVDLGVKAKIVQTVFLGAPDVSIDDYGLLKPK